MLLRGLTIKKAETCNGRVNSLHSMRLPQFITCRLLYLCVGTVCIESEGPRDIAFSGDFQDPVGNQLLVDGRGPVVWVWEPIVAE